METILLEELIKINKKIALLEAKRDIARDKIAEQEMKDRLFILQRVKKMYKELLSEYLNGKDDDNENSRC